MEMALQDELEGTVQRLVMLRRAALRSLSKAMGLALPPEGEGQRLAALKAGAVAPDSCGPEIPVAPARGRLLPVHPVEMVRTDDGYEAQHVGFAGRDAARASDVWDRMADQARRAGGADPFTPAQVAAARTYAALVERHSAVGLKGRSIETAGRGGSGARDGVMDLIIDEGRRITAMERNVGAGLALEVQRKGKGVRTGIPTLVLVRAVCLEGLTVSEVLVRHGWSAYGDVRSQAQRALAAALDRM